MLKRPTLPLFKRIKRWGACIYYLPLNISRHVFSLSSSVKRKIVFNNFNGRGFGENPEYIAREILRQNLPYDLVWLVSDLGAVVPPGIRKVRFNSLRASYELSTAKVVVNNVKNALPYIKKGNQYYIQTWHGELPFKYIEGECEDKLDPQYVKESKNDSSITDLLLSGSSLDTRIFKTCFWYSGEIMEEGLPRNDVYFNATREQVLQVKGKLGINSAYRVVLYAPTFRDNGEVDAYNLDAETLLTLLEEKTKQKWVMIVRMHPNVNRSSQIISYNDSIINGSTLSNPQDIVLASDLLVTDYSSIVADFMILGRPVLLFTSDLEEYKTIRGLRDLYFELPYVRASSNEALFEALNGLDIKQYKKQIERFVKERVILYDNGHASEHVVERIKAVMADL